MSQNEPHVGPNWCQTGMTVGTNNKAKVSTMYVFMQYSFHAEQRKQVEYPWRRRRIQLSMPSRCQTLGAGRASGVGSRPGQNCMQTGRGRERERDRERMAL
ncbi:hypothetical protein VFPPC_15798 [Pochonia chlamydosporia 170]|uniref:Uncharacterized protein n=1 Tax=Pochonia chlamydosporia 170 TaxID=1380566 RepID=A0A179FT07_METCM|nr:hypothetical protein VFPPC_15798 [Pochonia chlamydosporia 170]OAQ68223.1 hypothetical protein VFPPC_15798 [Pochonia chlamydosporia 170]